MTTPRVTEMPLRLESVEPDPFIDAQSRSTAARPRLTAQQQRKRRVELVRTAMLGLAGDGSAPEGIRNDRPARRTERA